MTAAFADMRVKRVGFSRWFLLFSVALFAGAALAADPATITFTERSNVATNVYITSESKMVSGTAGPWDVSVSPGNSSQYRIGGNPFTSAPGSISTGQTLTVRHLSASTAGATVTTTVLVGSSSILFKSATGALDRTPDPFSFGAKGMVAPNAVVESATIVPTGFNTGIPILAGPNLQYRIGAGAYTSASGTLQPDQTLTVRHTASAKRLEYTKTYLKVGGVVGYFTTRTQGPVEGTAYPLPDADRDGVADASDLCPGTPAGQAVDSNGCPVHVLNVSRSGEGTVTSTPGGIVCGADCSESYARNASVSLAAVPAAGFFFSGWGGDCSGAGACEVSMNQARSVFASFAPAAPIGTWLKGDMHVHTDHSSDGSGPRQGLDQRGPGNVSVSDQIGQGVLAGLDWMPLTDHRTFDQHYDPLWESADLLLMTGEEANGSPHANPIGAVDMIVQGGVTPGRPGWSVLQTSIWDAHSQGAAWSHNHPDDGHLNAGDTPNERANAVGADLMEAWNKASNIVRELAYAENRWNAGYRFGIVGACDDHFRELWLVAGPGSPTTHAFSGQLNERAVLQGLLAGRTVINARATATPFMTLEADLQRDGVYEAIAGDEAVAPPATAGRLRLRIQQGAGTTVSLYKNPGKRAGALETFMPSLPDETFIVDITTDAAAGWYYAEARGPGEVDAVDSAALKQPAILVQPDSGSDERRAITSPIFIGPTLAAPQPAVALPDSAGSDDGAQLVLGTSQQFNGFPDVSVSDGISHVVAEQHGTGRTAVMYRRMGGGSVNAAIDLAPLSVAARFPKVAARGNLVWVAWQDERSSQIPRRGAIMLRQSLDGGLTWVPEVALRSVAGRAEKPDLALMPDGKPVVVWQEISAGNPFDVLAQIVGGDPAPVNVSRAGKTIMAANASDTRSSRYPASVWPSVAVRADGRIAVAFHDNRTDPDPLWTGSVITGEDNATEVDNWQIMVATRPADSAFGAPVGFGNAARADRHPAIGYTANGALLAVWDSKTLNASGANLSVRSSLSTDNGATWSNAGDPPPFAHDAGVMSQYPRLGTDTDGSLRAVWYDSRAADWCWRVMTAVFDGAGWNSGELLLSRGINTWPATDGGQIVFSSTRNAARLQRDRTQQIFWLAPQN